jgi:hypothetical protein
VQVIEKITDANGQVEEKDKIFVWRVLETDVEMTVAGQTLRAIKVLRERADKDETKNRTYWFVPGVGKVREEGERTEVLESFHIEPQ